MTDAIELLRHRWATILVALLVLVAVALPAVQRVAKLHYRASAKVMLVNEDALRDPSVISDDLPAIATGTTVLSRVRDQLNFGGPVAELRRELSAKIGMHSMLMQISATDLNPERAIAIANATAQTTSDYYGEISGRRYNEINAGLQAQLRAARHRLAQIDVRARALAVGNPIVTSDKALDTLTAQIADLKNQRAQAFASFVSDQAVARAQAARSAEIGPVAESETLKSDPGFVAARDLYVKRSSELNAMRAEYTDKYPGIPELAKQVELDRAALEAARTRVLSHGVAASPSYASMLLDQRKAAAAEAGDRARVSAFDDQIGVLSGQLAQYVGDWTSLQSLRDDHGAAEAAVQALAQRLGSAQANAAEASSLGSVVVVDRAGRAEPRLTQSILVIGLLSVGVLCGALAIGLAADFIDPRLRTRRRIERLYGRPVIGAVAR